LARVLEEEGHKLHDDHQTKLTQMALWVECHLQHPERESGHALEQLAQQLEQPHKERRALAAAAEDKSCS